MLLDFLRYIREKTSLISVRIVLFCILPLIVIFTIDIFQNNATIQLQERTNEITKQNTPKAILALELLDEINDVRDSLSKYLAGNSNAFETYTSDIQEITAFLDEFNNYYSSKQDQIRRLNSMFERLQDESHRGVFLVYNPDLHAISKEKVKEMKNTILIQLEPLVKGLVEEEIEDAGTSGNIGEIINDDIPGIVHYMNLFTNVSKILSGLEEYLLHQESATQALFVAYENALENLKQLSSLEQRPQEQQNLRQVKAIITDLHDTTRSVIARNDSNNLANAKRNHLRIELLYLAPIEYELTQLSALSETEIVSGIEELEKEISSSQFKGAALSLLSILCSLLVFWLLKVSVLKPIQTVIYILDKLKMGFFDTPIPNTNQNNEIGKIYTSLQEFQLELKELELMRENRVKLLEGRYISELQGALEDVKSSEQYLLQQKEALQASNAELEQFIHIASHDLREPLKNTLGLLQILKVTVIDQLQGNSGELFEKINNSIQRQTRLIDNLRLLTKSSIIENIEENIQLEPIFTSAFNKISSKFEEQSIKLKIGTLPTTRGSTQAFNTLANILIQNVFDYAEPNSDLKIDAVDDGNHFTLVIKSKNPQPFEGAHSVFLPFWRGTNSHREHIGIGLTIAKKIVETALGGKIYLDEDQTEHFVIKINLKKSN